MKFLLGKKIVMSQRFRADCTVVPVTVISATPNTVTALRTPERDGYTAVQLGFGAHKKQNKPIAGHLKDLPAVETMREVRDLTGFERGAELKVTQFSTGEFVDVVGLSKGKGFQGVVKRHHFAGGPRTHGHKDNARMPGSIGAGGNQHVIKGTRMGGHMGDERVTVKNLEVMEINEAKHEIAVKGAVPGAHGSLVILKLSGDDSWTKAK